MTDMNTETIYRIAGRFDLTIPETVLEARRVLKAAEDLRAEVTVETAPDLTELTAGNLRRTHKAMVSYSDRDARLAAADTLVAVARERLSTAMGNAERSIEPQFVALTTETAATFTAALAVLGGVVDPVAATASPETAAAFGRLSDSANILDLLREVRSAYAHRSAKADVDTRFEQSSRMLVVPDKFALYRRRPTGSGVGYWAGAVQAGFAIAWQNVPSQRENWETYRTTSADGLAS